MCGIALIVGEGGSPEDLDRMMSAIRGRGEADERWSGPGLLAGTQRLKIVDREHARQPWISADGRWLLCFNGEVFNHEALRDELIAEGREFRSASDTEVVLEAFLAWGESAVERLRGEFAFAIVDVESGDAYLVRDAVGVKPLYYSWRHGRLHVASEIKALVGVGAQIEEVPPGHHGWARAGSGLDLRRWYDPYDEARRLGRLSDPDEIIAAIRETLQESIRIRVNTDLPVGVVLSGGLDSSLTLAKVAELHPDCVAFTIGSPGSDDLDYARRLAADLGVRHEVLTLAPSQIGPAQIREAIRYGELTEYGDVINAVVSIPLFRMVHEAGIKVVLTGDGSDELFGGYPMYHDVDAAQAERLFAHKIANLGRTELQRVDRTSMGQGVEARVPFLDSRMVSLAMRIPLSVKIGGEQEKWLVREAFKDTLPEYVLKRPKSGMSYSSGLHDRARLFKPLFPRIHRSFGYDLHAPIRRDFDTVLERAGNDLDLAVVEGAQRRDYNLYERGRDLTGALRWNVQHAITRKLATRRAR